MEFSERYIEICRVLHELHPRKPEEWQVGDWGININSMVIHQVVSLKDGFVCFTNSDCYDDEKVINWGWVTNKQASRVWIRLPTRESDWMRQPEWPWYWHLQLGASRDSWAIYDITQGELDPVIDWGSDPLDAMAEAWLKAMEAK